MPKINYGMIISDFDGTLVKDDGTVSQINKQAISKYIENGGIFAISTGRLPAGIVSRAKELGLKGVVSCCQGSVILDIQTEELFLNGGIPNAIAVKICEKMEEMGLHIHVYGLWSYYSNMDDEPLKWYENIVKHKAKLVTDKPISTFVKENGLDVCKILAIVAPSDNEKVREELKKMEFEGCSVTKSSEYLVEVLNENYSKGTAVEFLAKRYNIPIEKVIGVGDQSNDVSMIQTAGLGVAVKNASESLKAEADYVCEYTNEEHAIARIIEKFGYTEE